MHKKSGVKLNLSFSQQLSPLLSQTKQKSNKKKEVRSGGLSSVRHF